MKTNNGYVNDGVSKMKFENQRKKLVEECEKRKRNLFENRTEFKDEVDEVISIFNCFN